MCCPKAWQAACRLLRNHWMTQSSGLKARFQPKMIDCLLRSFCGMDYHCQSHVYAGREPRDQHKRSCCETCTLQVDKYDDPNTAVNRLMLALTSMGFELKFPASKLKQVSSKQAIMHGATQKAYGEAPIV